MRSVPLFLLAGFTLAAIEVDDLRKKAQAKTDSVRAESDSKRESIKARFSEFKNDLEKIKPGLDLQMPVDTGGAAKMRLVDHNELPGIPEYRKIFAIVTEDVTLKTWHSETDSQNLDRVRAGDKVEVVMVVNPRSGGTGFAWALVRTASGSEGYLPERLLKNVPEQAIPTSAKKEKKYVYVSSGLRMRSEPSLAGEFVALVPFDTEVTVTKYSAQKETIDGLSDYWAETSHDGKTGWLFNGYLRPVAQKPPPEPPQMNAGGFTMPVEGRLTSKFGPRIDPVSKKAGDFHRGIDIAAPAGEPIKAAKDGEVIESTTNKWWGNFIVLKHSGNVFTYYCHQSRKKAAQGQRVKAGDVIGYVGKTGKATGNHLHFEVRLGGDPKDPLQYVR